MLTRQMASMLGRFAAETGIASRGELLRRALALFVYLHRRSTTHEIVLRARVPNRGRTLDLETDEVISLATRQQLETMSPTAVNVASSEASRRLKETPDEKPGETWSSRLRHLWRPRR